MLIFMLGEFVLLLVAANVFMGIFLFTFGILLPAIIVFATYLSREAAFSAGFRIGNRILVHLGLDRYHSCYLRIEPMCDRCHTALRNKFIPEDRSPMNASGAGEGVNGC